MARKSKRPPKRSSPTVKYAAERAAARSAGRDPEAVPLPEDLGPAPAGMSRPKGSSKPPSSVTPAPAAPPAAPAVKARPRPKRGRPTMFTPAVRKAIVKYLESGMTYLDIQERPFMPHRCTILRWQDENQEFHDICARARARGLALLAEENIRIADAPAFDKVDVMRAELRIRTRQWTMERMAPKQWGPKQESTLKHEPSAVFLEALKAITPEPGQIGPESPAGLLPPGFQPREQSEDAEVIE